MVTFSFFKAQKTARTTRPTSLDALTGDYHEELRMAQQFQDHAAKAPYPYFAKRLQTLAEDEMKHARLLREQIVSMGGSVDPREITTKTGWNHWERLVVDLDDERVQGRLYQDQAVRVEADGANLRELLLELAEEEANHIRFLRDLILRSDPQAGR